VSDTIELVNKTLQPTRDSAGSSAIADGAFGSRVAELGRWAATIFKS
jgi:hypothetical protein